MIWERFRSNQVKKQGNWKREVEIDYYLFEFGFGFRNVVKNHGWCEQEHCDALEKRKE